MRGALRFLACSTALTLSCIGANAQETYADPEAAHPDNPNFIQRFYFNNHEDARNASPAGALFRNLLISPAHAEPPQEPPQEPPAAAENSTPLDDAKTRSAERGGETQSAEQPAETQAAAKESESDDMQGRAPSETEPAGGGGPSTPASQRSPGKRLVQRGRAAYYKHPGITANGERYKPDGLTAAHKTMRLGTWVEVVNLNTSRSVKLRINDRLPKGSKFVIDLSRGSARAIGMKDVAPVAIYAMDDEGDAPGKQSGKGARHAQR